MINYLLNDYIKEDWRIEQIEKSEDNKIQLNFHLCPSEPANYTGSYTAEYRVIIAGILKEMIIDNKSP